MLDLLNRDSKNYTIPLNHQPKYVKRPAAVINYVFVMPLDEKL